MGREIEHRYREREREREVRLQCCRNSIRDYFIVVPAVQDASVNLYCHSVVTQGTCIMLRFLYLHLRFDCTSTSLDLFNMQYICTYVQIKTLLHCKRLKFLNPLNFSHGFMRPKQKYIKTDAISEENYKIKA